MAKRRPGVTALRDQVDSVFRETPGPYTIRQLFRLLGLDSVFYHQYQNVYSHLRRRQGRGEVSKLEAPDGSVVWTATPKFPRVAVDDLPPMVVCEVPPERG